MHTSITTSYRCVTESLHIIKNTNMKNIINYLHAPSSIYKSVTKGAVILTNIVCMLLCFVAAIAETHPVAAIFITSIIGGIVYLTKTTPNESNQ